MAVTLRLVVIMAKEFTVRLPEPMEGASMARLLGVTVPVSMVAQSIHQYMQRIMVVIL